jgi:hypothetical protein
MRSIPFKAPPPTVPSLAQDIPRRGNASTLITGTTMTIDGGKLAGTPN